MTIRRLKTYASSQGFVYQYYFVGQRQGQNPAPEGAKDPAAEYVFDVTSDRKHRFALRILLPDNAVAQWNQDHGRELTGPERYAAVKMSLFRAFDETADLLHPGCELTVTAEMLQRVLQELGVD